MKVGIIGLGRMGEGMSRRLIKAGHEVWGYRNNYEKACHQYEEGYISGCTTSLESLVQIVHSQKSVYDEDGQKFDCPGVFMMVVPAETVEDTLNELLQFCVEGDIIIDHGNSNFKDSRRRAERLSKLGIQYLDCGTSGGVYGLERGYCLMVGGANTAVSVCSPIFRALAPGLSAAPRTDPKSLKTSAEYGWLHCGPPGAGQIVWNRVCSRFLHVVHSHLFREYAFLQWEYGWNVALLPQTRYKHFPVRLFRAVHGPQQSPKAIPHHRHKGLVSAYQKTTSVLSNDVSKVL